MPSVQEVQESDACGTRDKIRRLAESSGGASFGLFDGLSDEPYLKQTPAANTNNSGVEISMLRVTVRLMRSEVPFMINALVEPKFSSGSSTGATGSVPGRSSEDAPKTGSIEEQNALQFPFRIVQLSEYTHGGPETQSGRHSVLDIAK